MDVLRLVTLGSVDDGKSTLIGRLLYDSHVLLEDQLHAITHDDEINLAHVTDGLKAERHQGITIDVAYRYFTTTKRKFILADAPGHEQFLRNAVTASSNADVAVLLVDATLGMTEQTRRHAVVASLMGIETLVVCVSKMDKVNWGRDVFQTVAEDCKTFVQRLRFRHVHVVPISALLGDNVVVESKNMSWYDGQPLLQILELKVVDRDKAQSLRLAVQDSFTHQGMRWYTGQLWSGELRVGDEVVVLPNNIATRVTRIESMNESMKSARSVKHVTFCLDNDVAERGSLIAMQNDKPHTGNEANVTCCWLAEKSLRVGEKFLLRVGTNETPCTVSEIMERLDVTNAEWKPANAIVATNEVVKLKLTTRKPIWLDNYYTHRNTGGMILVDLQSGNTVAAAVYDVGDAR